MQHIMSQASLSKTISYVLLSSANSWPYPQIIRLGWKCLLGLLGTNAPAYFGLNITDKVQIYAALFVQGQSFPIQSNRCFCLVQTHGLIRKYQTGLEMLARDKCSSLFWSQRHRQSANICCMFCPRPAFPIQSNGCFCLVQTPGLTCKYQTGLEKLANGKHSSLFWPIHHRQNGNICCMFCPLLAFPIQSNGCFCLAQTPGQTLDRIGKTCRGQTLQLILAQSSQR